MKKNIFGRKFKRDINERKALFKSLMSSLVLNERIKTTEAKAKAIKGQVEKLITKAKKGNARRSLAKSLSSVAIDKMIEKIAPRFEKRQGGYTRIIRIGKRFSDHASMVLMEWTEKQAIETEKKPEIKSTKKAESKKIAKNTKNIKKKDVKKESKPKTQKNKETKK